MTKLTSKMIRYLSNFYNAMKLYLHAPDKQDTLHRSKMEQLIQDYMINYELVKMGSPKNGEVGFIHSGECNR